MTDKDYIDPKGYWGDPEGNIRRMSGEQEIIATVTGHCSEAYIRHLDKFSRPERGPVLKKEGQKRKFQYGFVEPMMQPYVLMKGLTDGEITEEQLSVLSSPSSISGLPFDPIITL